MSSPIEPSRIEAARREERRNNTFARELAMANRTNAEGTLISVGFLETVQKRAQWGENSMAWLRDEKCGGCVYGSDEAKACTSFGDATLFREAPMCKWSTREAAEKRERDLTGERLQRLLAAGCTDQEIRRLVPVTRIGKPPLPDPGLLPPERRTELMAGPREAMECAEQFISNRSLLTLVLMGGNGVGKTMAAGFCVAAEGRESCWVQASQWDSFERIREVSERAEWCDLLVVDELGTEQPTGPFGIGAPALCELMLRRRNRNTRTIVTTNLTGAQLRERYDGRWVDRLEQDGLVASCGQQSLRSYTRRDAD